MGKTHSGVRLPPPPPEIDMEVFDNGNQPDSKSGALVMGLGVQVSPLPPDLRRDD